MQGYRGNQGCERIPPFDAPKFDMGNGAKLESPPYWDPLKGMTQSVGNEPVVVGGPPWGLSRALQRSEANHKGWFIGVIPSFPAEHQ